MGFAFFELANVITEHSFPRPHKWYPQIKRAAILWGCAGVTVIVLVPLMGFLVWHRARLERRLEAARNTGDAKLAARLHVLAGTQQTFMSWGCAFTLAGQIDAAAMATVPASPWGWRALYVS